MNIEQYNSYHKLITRIIKCVSINCKYYFDYSTENFNQEILNLYILVKCRNVSFKDMSDMEVAMKLQIYGNIINKHYAGKINPNFRLIHEFHKCVSFEFLLHIIKLLREELQLRIDKLN